MVVATVGAIVLTIYYPVGGVVFLLGVVAVGLVLTRIRIAQGLIVYGLTLFLVPSRFTVSDMAVTLPMLVGLVVTGMAVFAYVLPSGEVPAGKSPVVPAAFTYFVATLMLFASTSLNAVGGPDVGAKNRALAGALVLCGVAVAAAQFLRTRREVNLLIGAIVFGGALLGLIGLIQYITDVDITPYVHPPGFSVDRTAAFIYDRAGVSRVAATARHPIEFGLACAVALPLALHLSAFGRTATARLGARTAGLLLAAGVALSLARSAILALAVAAIIFVPSWAPERRWKVVGATALLVLVLSALAPTITDTIQDLVAGRTGQGSSEVRSQASDEAFELIADRPVWGRGYGAVQREIEQPLDNQYLTSGVEGGAVALGAVVIITFSGVLAAWRARRQARDPAGKDLAMSLLASIVAFAVGGVALNTFIFPMIAGLGFLCIGTAGALARLTARGADASPRPGAMRAAIAR
jgi:O-antigen ligase